jgi:hypothetical protein
MTSLPLPLMTAFIMNRERPLIWSQLYRRWQREFLAIDHNFYQGGSWMAQGLDKNGSGHAQARLP